MTHGYTVIGTARLVSALRWATGRLSEIVGAWAADAASQDPETAVWLTALSRRLGSHCEALAEHQPDSERLAAYRGAQPPGTAVEAAVDEIGAVVPAAERFAVARRVLAPQIRDAYAEVCAHGAPHCDAALASTAEMLRCDLQRHCDATDRCNGESAPASGRAGPGDSVAGAERRLRAAGGIVPRSLLRPHD